QILLSCILQNNTQFEGCAGGYHLKIIFQAILRRLTIAVNNHTITYLDTPFPLVTDKIEIIHIHPRCSEGGTEEPASTTKRGQLILFKIVLFALLFPLPADFHDPSLPSCRARF